MVDIHPSHSIFQPLVGWIACFLSKYVGPVLELQTKKGINPVSRHEIGPQM